MIFKLLVVDDEATMRKGIANYMNWASIDCEVAGTASDGLEAMEFLEKYPVDIVITDIKMPGADGLEVARFIYERQLDIKVILLTGYADFAYAQTAIRYNVSSFILKPTNKKSLFEAVQEAQKELIISKKNSSIAKEELAFLKEQLLQELTDQPLTPDLTERLNKFEICLEHYCVAAFRMIPMGEDLASLKKIIIDEKHNAYCYRYNHFIICVYFLKGCCKDIPPDILENCREIVEISGTLDSRKAAVGISRYHTGAQEFGTAVSEAIQALTMNFYSETPVAEFSEAAVGGEYDLTAENSMDLFQFENCLISCQFEKAENILGNIFMKFKSNLVNSRDAKNICSQIYYICSRVLIKKEAETPAPEFMNRIHGSSDIFSLEKAAEELVQYTKECLLRVSGSQNKLVDYAIQYIHGHLADLLSLEVLAEQLHISPSHLSRTFKRDWGESLTEYINKARIEKAKEYLSDSDILAYEIAELVGYHDPTYFSSIFKKYTGFSPTDYKQKMQGK